MHDLLIEAQTVIPGGVNSPVRAFKGVGGEPLFFKRGVGQHIFDEENKGYIDYVLSWGALILGHAHPKIVETLHHTAQLGTSFGAPTVLEVQLASKIIALMPHLEMIRMVSSGTEATMTAIRMARAITGKSKILKFEGCYHGHSDSFLAKAGSGLLTLGIAASEGVPLEIAEHTLTVPFNDIDSAAKICEHYRDEIAAIIVEPVAGNMGCILPKPDFLRGLRQLCDDYHALLIFDEVITGFRIGLSGAARAFNVTPDLTTLGKVIGGGLPAAAIGGKRAIMECLAPVGKVYQAGTLSGNPLAMAAGLATLTELEKPHFFETLSMHTQTLLAGMRDVASTCAIPFHTVQLGAMFGLFFTEKPVVNLSDISGSHVERYKKFFHGMLREGIYFAPSAFEAGFISGAYTETDLEKTLDAAHHVFRSLQE